MVHSVLELYRNEALLAMFVWCFVRVTHIRGCVTKKRFGESKCDKGLWIWANYAGEPSEVFKAFVI